MLKKTALLACAFAASTALQPVPAHARGEGAAVAAGIIGGLIVAAAGAGAQSAAARQQAQQAQQACLLWLPVVNDQRYDAATRQYALQTVTTCGLSVPNVAPMQATAPVYVAPVYAPTPAPAPLGAPSVAYERRGGTEVAVTNTRSGHIVTAAVNGTNVPFLLDTGASISAIPRDVALALVRQGRLSRDDLLQPIPLGLANGAQIVQPTVALNITLGGRTKTLRVVVNPEGSDPLLGTDVLKQFGSYMVDNRRGVLILN